MGNGKELAIHNTGNVGNGKELAITDNGILPTPNQNFKLYDIPHVPDISSNLISVVKFTRDNDCAIIFTSNAFYIQAIHSKQILLSGPCENGVYPISHLLPPRSNAPMVFKCQSPSSIKVWHLRLGHPSIPILQSLINQSLVPRLFPSNCVCGHCCVAKSHKLPFKSSISVVSHPFQLVHSDVWGPSPTPSFNGFRY